jgi:hypothetical protein
MGASQFNKVVVMYFDGTSMPLTQHFILASKFAPTNEIVPPPKDGPIVGTMA